MDIIISAKPVSLFLLDGIENNPFKLLSVKFCCFENRIENYERDSVPMA